MINADDLGLTPGVNDGIFAAMDAGVVSDASLMANGRAFDHAVAGLRARGIDATGLHLCLVDVEQPLAPREAVAPLLDGDHFLVNRNRLFLRAAARPGAVRRAVERELSCQYDKVRAAGLRVSHLDSHQHVHLFPGIARTVVDFCARQRIPFVRVVKPQRSSGVAATAVRLFSGRVSAAARRAGIVDVPSFGFENSGRVTAGSMAYHVSCAQQFAVAEVMVHPGRADAAARSRYPHWHYDWDRELSVVLAARDTLRAAGVNPVSYASLGVNLS